MSFGDKLEELRKGRGFSRREVSIATGITEATIYNYERSKSTPSFSNAVVLADFFGINVAELSEGGIR